MTAGLCTYVCNTRILEIVIRGLLRNHQEQCQHKSVSRCGITEDSFGPQSVKQERDTYFCRCVTHQSVVEGVKYIRPRSLMEAKPITHSTNISNGSHVGEAGMKLITLLVGEKLCRVIIL